MTKSELIEALALSQRHLAYADVEMAVKSLLEQMSQSLATGKRIEKRPPRRRSRPDQLERRPGAQPVSGG